MACKCEVLVVQKAWVLVLCSMVEVVYGAWVDTNMELVVHRATVMVVGEHEVLVVHGA